MPDPVPLLRWALYLTTGGAFGLALFAWTNRGAASRLPWRGAVAALAALALALSVVGLWVLAASMSGMPLAGTGLAEMQTVAGLPGIGTAWWARTAALALLLGIVALAPARHHASAAACTVLSGLALGSLAWTGHAALGEGAAGLLHLSADIAHLLAAGAWLGAIAALLWFTASADARDPGSVAVAHDALGGFAIAGTVLVAVLVATGLVNSWFLVGPDNIAALPDSGYGRLLIAKLLLFAVMLALAASNRWRLTPALGRDGAPALAAVRRSVALELAVGVAVLGVVAWLGLMPPPGLG